MACGSTQIDEAYEFSAPKFFDFLNEETEEEVRNAEIWFDLSTSHAPSPFMPKIKEGRKSVKIESLCDFGDVAMETDKDKQNENIEENSISEVVKEESQGRRTISFGLVHDGPSNTKTLQNETSQLADSSSEEPSFNFPIQPVKEMETSNTGSSTPKIAPNSVKNRINSIKTPKTKESIITKPTAKKIASVFQNPPVKKTPLPLLSQKSNSVYRSLIKSHGKAKNEIAQENQPVKRQKLDFGRTRQILNVKPIALAHKSRADPNAENSHSLKNGASFVSAAEMVKKFESGTRNHLSHDERRPVRLALTRPKEPELQTAQRVRAVRIKSSEELEAEMLAKIPKFKAKPFNKKLLEAPPLPPVHKSTLHPPEFKEFYLKTSERANRHAETSSEASTQDFTFQLTEPRPPRLQTSMRARPPTVKSSQELELEQVFKAPKFKARPLNRKILDGKVEISHPKPPVNLTQPKEFHFATDARLGPAPSVLDSFDKLSLHSEASTYRSQKEAVPKLTFPNPFHLQTEERGVQKEMILQIQLSRKQEEEERARLIKANPYPYTTDYPVVPPKPEPKPCTKPSTFQLESLVRHEEEMKRLNEERERLEREERERRLYRAQPILKEDPIPVPAKERRPLTEVQGFALHVDQRSVQRQEFDNKVKEKETVYKRMREEAESVKQIEEEKALKQLRRTMVPHARPLPKFEKPFVPQRSKKETTKAKSPHWHVDERGEIRRQKTSFMR
ncbi:hypothetical protein LUZ60_010809 [Juncus effusus]|nr:hypothetical protein LUZ60_010809 [Juncus effusus]